MLWLIPRWRFWQKYVDQAVQDVGLGEWRITVQKEYSKSTEFIAWIVPNVPYRFATLSFAKAFFKLPPSEQRAIIAHELTHLWWATKNHIMDEMEKHVRGVVSVRAWDQIQWNLWDKQLCDAEEYGVEQISRLLMHAMTLPQSR